MTLSLIWALIFHYQLQVWVDSKDKQTAKGSLLNWVREAVINVGYPYKNSIYMMGVRYIYVYHMDDACWMVCIMNDTYDGSG